jgi:hypothetical protein
MDRAPTTAELAAQILPRARELARRGDCIALGWDVLVETTTESQLVDMLDEAEEENDPDAVGSRFRMAGSGGEPTFEGALSYIAQHYVLDWAGKQIEDQIFTQGHRAGECPWGVGDRIEQTSPFPYYPSHQGSGTFIECAVVTQVLTPTLVEVQVVNGPRQDFELRVMVTDPDWTKAMFTPSFTPRFETGDVLCFDSQPMDGAYQVRIEVLECGDTHMRVKYLNTAQAGEVVTVGTIGWQRYVPVLTEACQDSRPHLAHRITLLVDEIESQRLCDCPGVEFPAEVTPPLAPEISTRQLLTITAEGYGWSVVANIETGLEFERTHPVKGLERLMCHFTHRQTPDRLTGVDYVNHDHGTRSWSVSNPSYTRREWALYHLTH